MEIAFKPHATLLMQKCIETSQLTASHFKEMKFSYDQCTDLSLCIGNLIGKIVTYIAILRELSHIFYRKN